MELTVSDKSVFLTSFNNCRFKGIYSYLKDIILIYSRKWLQKIFI